MKPSKYNFFLKDRENVICFNAFSFRFFTIQQEKEETVKDIINNPDTYANKIPIFFSKLKNGKFIVNNDIYEPGLVMHEYDISINAKHYKLVILPTLQCNFRCWYCIQHHVKGKMENDIRERIYKHIEYMIVNEKIKSLSLDWFGGEPFLFFFEIIKPISDFAKTMCENHAIPFYSSATTNGFLVTPEVVDQLKDYNYKGFQITLDGDREHHNQTRKSSMTSSFDTILNNINYICSKLDCIVNIRINYDDKNLEPEKIIEQVNKIIIPERRDKIRFIFRRIWQVNSFEEERKKLTKASSILRKENYAMNVDLIQNFLPCYASSKYYNTISFNGNVYKCTAKESMHEDSLGYLDEEGIIQWHNENFENIYYKPLFDNSECSQCKYLPICMGPCSKGLEDNGLNSFKHYCRGKVNGFEFEDSMLNYCREFSRR